MSMVLKAGSVMFGGHRVKLGKKIYLQSSDGNKKLVLVGERMEEFILKKENNLKNFAVLMRTWGGRTIKELYAAAKNGEKEKITEFIKKMAPHMELALAVHEKIETQSLTEKVKKGPNCLSGKTIDGIFKKGLALVNLANLHHLGKCPYCRLKLIEKKVPGINLFRTEETLEEQLTRILRSIIKQS